MAVASFGGIKIIRSRHVKPGEMIVMGDAVLMDELTRFRVEAGRITGLYTPLWSRYTLGERERQRDQRRYGGRRTRNAARERRHA